jgi:hypothetical protein
MKRPTPASLKKLTAENLAALGADRLAAILIDVAQSRPEVKRQLRMELAAEQGAEHLAVEIDKWLASLDASRSKVSWRRRPTFVRDLDLLRQLIGERLAALDRAGALIRMWSFMALARRVGGRVRDRDGELAAVFARAAADLGALISDLDGAGAAEGLVEAIVHNPFDWADWLPAVLSLAPPALADAALRQLSERRGAVPGWINLIRQLADAAGDVDAYRSTYADGALRTPSIAAEIAQRLLAADRVEEAGGVLEAANLANGDLKPLLTKASPAEVDFAWETAWIDYLERSGQGEAAQAARWSSFERTFSAERARDFTCRLADFQDVEAENRAFDLAAKHPDFQRGLRFLMDWPALAEAGRMIQSRSDDVAVTVEQAEQWATALQVRQPAAAIFLLRKAAAAAFRRRDFKTCDRLTAEADSLGL